MDTADFNAEMSIHKCWELWYSGFTLDPADLLWTTTRDKPWSQRMVQTVSGIAEIALLNSTAHPEIKHGEIRVGPDVVRNWRRSIWCSSARRRGPLGELTKPSQQLELKLPKDAMSTQVQPKAHHITNSLKEHVQNSTEGVMKASTRWTRTNESQVPATSFGTETESFEKQRPHCRRMRVSANALLPDQYAWTWAWLQKSQIFKGSRGKSWHHPTHPIRGTWFKISFMGIPTPNICRWRKQHGWIC